MEQLSGIPRAPLIVGKWLEAFAMVCVISRILLWRGIIASHGGFPPLSTSHAGRRYSGSQLFRALAASPPRVSAHHVTAASSSDGSPSLHAKMATGSPGMYLLQNSFAPF